MSEQPSPDEGWYPVDDHTERFWNGNAWSDATRPRQRVERAETADTSSSSRLAVAGVLAASLVGLVLSLQSASLLTGTGTIWLGVAIAGGAVIFAFVFKVRRWLKIVAIIVALLALVNAVSVESSLNDIREDISSDLE